MAEMATLYLFAGPHPIEHVRGEITDADLSVVHVIDFVGNEWEIPWTSIQKVGYLPGLDKPTAGAGAKRANPDAEEATARALRDLS